MAADNNIPIDDLTALAEKLSQENADLGGELKDILQHIAPQHTIIREIQLQPAHYQAGLSLLNFLGRVIELAEPNVKYVLTTEQKPPLVELRIAAQSDKQQAIQEIIEKYSLILQNKAPMSLLFDENESAIMELKQKLDLSALELSITHTVVNQQDIALPSDFEGIREQVEQLHQQIGQGLSGVSQLKRTIDFLLSQQNDQIAHLLTTLKEKLEQPINEDSRAEIHETLVTIQEKEPNAFYNLQHSLNMASDSKDAGNRLVSWLVQLNNIIPH